MREKKKFDFNFNHVEEVKIYRHAVEEDSRKIKKVKKIDEKYYTYKDWREQHVIKKYEHITYKSLCDFNKYLNRKLENEKDKDNSMSGFIYPILIGLITMMAAYVSDGFQNSDFKMLVTLFFIVFFTYYIIKYKMFEDIAIKNLYRDYAEIIEEMIKDKKSLEKNNNERKS
ncbi:hypothetical protein [Anaerocolumna jejuensis]|uniref:hypothetical protein n=1 Tax=Anaerocolumna jejuensis TaxID=259063 RepID=UPI003F7BCEDE